MKKLFNGQIIYQSFKSVYIWCLILCLVMGINFFSLPTMIVDKSLSEKLLELFVSANMAGNGVIFTSIFAIVCANAFLTSEIDRGTLSVTLNTPTTRLQVVMSKALIFILSFVFMGLISGACGSLSPIAFGFDFDNLIWWKIILSFICYSFVLSAICFIVCCYFNKSRYALGVNSLILGWCFLIDTLAQMEKLEFLKYFTLQSLYNTKDIMSGENLLINLILMIVIGIILYIFGIRRFLKKDLPI